MTGRDDIEKLLRGAYAARQRGDVDAICAMFAPDARFEMAGAQESPTTARVHGHDEFRPLLKRMIDTFEMRDHSVLAVLVEGDRAAVHWQATFRSSVTGETVKTDLVDLIGVENGKIKSFLEFCDTALAERLLKQA